MWFGVNDDDENLFLSFILSAVFETPDQQLQQTTEQMCI